MSRKGIPNTTSAKPKQSQSYQAMGAARREPVGGEPVAKPACVTQQAPQSVGQRQTTAPATLTHAQIAKRAQQIWEKKGRPVGQDERNWLEAESQLKRELGVK